jgi:hypothetical protein
MAGAAQAAVAVAAGAEEAAGVEEVAVAAVAAELARSGLGMLGAAPLDREVLRPTVGMAKTPERRRVFFHHESGIGYYFSTWSKGSTPECTRSDMSLDIAPTIPSNGMAYRKRGEIKPQRKLI